jgi:polygalacturonase
LIWGKGLSRGWGVGPKAEDPGVANKAIALKNCRNVLLRDFSILHGGHFGILATGVDNLTIDNLKIDTNRDGMDVDCCRNVRITNCSVNSPWDDGICLKSSFALGYARATEMVTISNCLVAGSYEGRGAARWDVQALCRGRQSATYWTDQVRDGIEWRVQEHHDFELRV